jgi:hypothetical protein
VQFFCIYISVLSLIQDVSNHIGRHENVAGKMTGEVKK